MYNMLTYVTGMVVFEIVLLHVYINWWWHQSSPTLLSIIWICTYHLFIICTAMCYLLLVFPKMHHLYYKQHTYLIHSGAWIPVQHNEMNVHLNCALSRPWEIWALMWSHKSTRTDELPWRDGSTFAYCSPLTFVCATPHISCCGVNNRLCYSK